MSFSGEPSGPAWPIVARVQAYRGEARANLLRVLGVAGFYTIHVINYRGLSALGMERVSGVDTTFHAAVTALAVAWVLLACGVIICMRAGLLPSALKYITTSVDVLLLTGMLMIADGPRSPLIVAFPLVVALSGLRFHRHLVTAATAGSAAGYLLLLGHTRLYRPALAVARYEQVTLLLAIVLTGVVVAQLLGGARALAADYADRNEDGLPASTRTSPEYTDKTWLGAVGLCSLVLLVLAVELALSWPGLMVPFALVGLPVVIVMLRAVARRGPR